MPPSGKGGRYTKKSSTRPQDSKGRKGGSGGRGGKGRNRGPVNIVPLSLATVGSQAITPEPTENSTTAKPTPSTEVASKPPSSSPSTPPQTRAVVRSILGDTSPDGKSDGVTPVKRRGSPLDSAPPPVIAPSRTMAEIVAAMKQTKGAAAAPATEQERTGSPPTGPEDLALVNWTDRRQAGATEATAANSTSQSTSPANNKKKRASAREVQEILRRGGEVTLSLRWT